VLMGEIAAASKEQSQGISQVNQAMVGMNSATQQNAASAEELAAAMAMFRTHHGDFKESRRLKGAGKKGRPPVALPEKSEVDESF
jgi:hypothetical protein